ncbi:hypothetical protein [Leuconostoc citreum]|uniref:hypothetical protein n=1 Tax=Leuconostoc citreum TaxID=33964 RepID=UPI0015DEF036|nr:hypothetical protein [Leuconostoc citreum]
MSKSKVMIIKLNKNFSTEKELRQRVSGAWKIKIDTIINNKISHIVVMYHQVVIADYCLGNRIGYHLTGLDKGRVWFDLEPYEGKTPLKGKKFNYKTANPATTKSLTDLLDLEVKGAPISTTSLQTKIINFIRQPIPDNIGVISQSVPVLFFGNIETARSATISLNPSDLEFRDNKQQLLTANKKRLVDRDILHKKDTDYLSLEEAEKVYNSCINYFNKFPYKQWFNQLNRILSPLGFSYFENSLIHLDITPWATYPKWANLVTKQEVLKASQNISDYIIQQGQLKYLFINGNGAFEHVKSYYSDINVQTTEIIWLDSRKCTVYTGKIGNCRFIAWSLYVQAALTINDRNALTMAISERL